MKAFTRILKAVGVSVFGLSLLATAPVAKAQTNPTYSTPVFNSFATGSPSGDERDFVRIAANGSTTYNNDFTACADGAVAKVWVYIHNNAAKEYNGTNFDGSGVAKDVTVAVNAPFGTTASNFAISGAVNASNATTATDGATITCGGEEYKLEFVSNSARIYTHKLNGVQLDDAIVNGGVKVGSDALDGKWAGCWEFVGTIELQVKLTKKPAPVVSKECKALTISQTEVKSGSDVTVTATGAANNTTILGYVFTVKNASGAVVSTQEVTTNATSANYTFKQSTAGSYTVSSSVKFADGNVTAEACEKTVKVKAPTPPTIPDTGAGNVIGALSAIAIIGAILHRMWTVRRVSR